MKQAYIDWCFSHLYLSLDSSFCSFFRTISCFLLQKADLHTHETDIKIKGQPHYLCILPDSKTRIVIAFCLFSARETILLLPSLKSHPISQMQTLLPLLQIDIVNIFFSKIPLTMLPVPKPHNTVCVLAWEEPRHWLSRTSGCSSNWWSIRLDAYHIPLMFVYSKSKRHVYDSFCNNISNHVIKSFHKTFKAWYKTKKDSIVLNLLWISFLIFYFIIIYT